MTHAQAGLPPLVNVEASRVQTAVALTAVMQHIAAALLATAVSGRMSGTGSVFQGHQQQVLCLQPHLHQKLRLLLAALWLSHHLHQKVGLFV